jgi:hypothetical protein
VRIALPLCAALLAAPFLALAPVHAQAQAKGQTYRCTGKDGKKYYGQAIPQACVGQPMELLNAQGMVVKRFDPQATAAERAQREAEEAERKKREAISKEEGRRNRALLATYTSEKDIDEARARALADNRKAVQEVQTRIEAARKRRAGYDKELDFYKGGAKPPAKLAEDVQAAESEIKANEELLSVKQKEIQQINARYDEDRKRYRELTRAR